MSWYRNNCSEDVTVNNYLTSSNETFLGSNIVCSNIWSVEYDHLPEASLLKSGIVQLSSNHDSISDAMAATPSAVKFVWDSTASLSNFSYTDLFPLASYGSNSFHDLSNILFPAVTSNNHGWVTSNQCLFTSCNVQVKGYIKVSKNR
jgi:hypothetical protein